MAGVAVGWFEIQVAGDEPRLTHVETHGSIEICGNEQFYLGRDTELCRYYWADDLTISRQHLRVHCILYEQDPVATIAPLVYVTDLSTNGTYLKKSNTKCSASQGQGILMGQNCTFLLDNDDELRLSDTVTLMYRSTKLVEDTELTPVQERETNVFASRYLVTGRLLGEGGYGKVLVGVHQETQRQLACKVIKLNHLYEKLPVHNLRLPNDQRDLSAISAKKRWPTKIANCFREFDILKDLSHPNIVTLEKVFWTHNTIYIFLELVTGGDLFSFLEFKGGRLDDIQAAVIVRQILKGVEYLHDQDIVHRDLKPDNILMTSPEDGARVVITDFGNARFLPGRNSASALLPNKYQRMFSYVGTLEFAAPEVHRANRAIPAEKGYSKSIDMWSLGSITAAILTGDVIFTDRNHPKYSKDPRTVIIELAAICNLSVLDEDDHPLWGTVGDRPKHFIKGLLVLEEDARLTASEALKHPWFSCYAEDFEELYARSIEGWEPRQKNVQLVERISKVAPNLVASDLAVNVSSQETASRFFSSSETGPTHDMLQKLSTSQYWRANTPLPSIRDEYDAAQFASQVQPASCESNSAVEHESHQGDDTNTPSRYDQQSYENESKLYEANWSQNPEQSTRHSLLLANTTAPGMIYNNKIANDDESYGSGVSLNRVMNDYSQQGYYARVRQLQFSNKARDLVPVGDTPKDQDIESQEYIVDSNRQPEESYHETHFSNRDHREETQMTDQDSVLVYETPPEVGRKHSHSQDSDLLRYIQWPDEESEPDQADMGADAQKYAKRRRLSHHEK
ncbi:Nn.00g069950.m01.CDS01 [Neocucurbitaria sp. VM-36]